MSNNEHPGESSSEEDSNGAEQGASSKLQLPPPPQLVGIPGLDARKIIGPPPERKSLQKPPELLKLGGEEAFEEYRKWFDRTYRSTEAIFDVRGYAVDFDAEACWHVCFTEDRHDKRRQRAAGEERTRHIWHQDRAEHMSWILPTLQDPAEIVANNQVPGNEVYLLGFPLGDLMRPNQRYYVAVKPIGPKRLKFKTAYSIDQRYWNNARRGKGPDHTKYRRRGPRW